MATKSLKQYILDICKAHLGKMAFMDWPIFDSVVPVINGTAALGVSMYPAREDHVHPTDTTRAALAGSASQAFSASTPAINSNTTLVATTAWYMGQGSNSVPLVDSGTGGSGTSTAWSRYDHQHPTDTSRMAGTKYISGSSPSGGVDGDVWYMYV